MKFKFITIFLTFLLISTILLSSCSSNVDESNKENSSAESSSLEKATYIKITPEEAKELMIDDNIILDVRTQQEYDDGHIANATLLPLDEIISGNLEVLTDKDQVILVYCRSGNRSKSASKALIDSGYTNVYDFGGIADWPYDIEK